MRCLSFVPILVEKTPSEASFCFILDKVPAWERLVVSLGVPIDQVEALQDDPIMGGFRALRLWQSGLYTSKGYPPTWDFLLKTVKDFAGPLVSEEIAERAAVDEYRARGAEYLLLVTLCYFSYVRCLAISHAS